MWSALRPGKPHPVLYLAGEEGAGKSSLVKILRLLVDPSDAPLRTLPTTVRDLFVSVHNGYVQSFDNVSKISAAISDALCQISSGSGFGTRRMFTDSEQLLVSGSRPMVLNGRANAITRSDLADRTVVLNLSPIKQEDRRSENEFWAELAKKRPRILGTPLDAVVQGLRKEPRVRLDRKPRMVDFALRSVAAETAFAHEGAFMRAFESSPTETVEALIESAVAAAIGAFMVERDHWSDTATLLWRTLSDHDSMESRPSQWASWPRNPSAFSCRLRSVAASLRKIGIAVEFGKAPDRRRTRIIKLCKVAIERSQQSDRRAADADRTRETVAASPKG